MNFIVVVNRGIGPRLGVEYVGPYRSFKQAEGDAKAWNGTEGRECWVEPLKAPNKEAENGD